MYIMWAFSLLGVFFAASAETLPDDAYLYYRRTHNGALPPPDVDPSDHSGETTNSTVAPKPQAPGALTPGLLDNGVDPANLGLGDWIWQMSTCTNKLGAGITAVTNVQSLIDWEKSHGMQWITVKCGDGGSLYPSSSAPQFAADLVTRAHNAGLKIFGWAYAYGNNVSGEINVALNALSLGTDGFIIDAEFEYETNVNNSAKAALYAGTIKSNYPTRFLAHAPFPIISSHSGFPYVAFGTNCDAVMPQAYWADIGGTNYAVTMVTRMNTEWRNWQNSLTGAATNAIKPIAPIGQGYNSVNGDVDGTQITTFINTLKTNPPPATASGYRGLSWWSCQHHGAAPDKWPAIGAAAIDDFTSPPYIYAQLLGRVVDAGKAFTLFVSAAGVPALAYQWRLNGTNVPGATSSNLTFAAVQMTNAGNYVCVVTNASGSVTSGAMSLTVYPVQTAVFADAFDADTAADWTVNKSSADTRVIFNYDYSPNGIPSAPHSTGGTTRGVRMEANLTAGAVAALSISPMGQSFDGDYRLHFDMWINVNGPLPGGGNGSTEFLTGGIGTAGNRVQWTGGGTAADGFWFSVDGEGGAGDTSTTFSDYAAYIGTTVQSTSTGIYAAGTDANARGNGNSFYLTAFPAGLAAPVLQQSSDAQQTGVLNVGTVGFAWHDVIISRRGSMVDWAIDGIRMATISSATFTASNVFVGYWDPFSSLSDNTNLSFGLVDNVRVEVPAIAPTISLQPANLSVKLTSNATFTVTATGLPAPSYQWRFNNTNISGATVSGYTRTNAQPGDVGNYSVVITNIAGSLASSNAALTLIPPAPAQFQLVSLQPDRSLRIVFNGDPAWTYTVETSTNLIHWSTLTNLTSASGVFDFIAGSTTNDTQRFYRARSGP